MRYQNEINFRHDAPETLGVLLVNLGTPDSPAVADVRRYLAEFLSDPRVIEMPRLLWQILLRGVILRARPQRSAQAYQQVWTPQGSPLLDMSRRQAAALQTLLETRYPGSVRVALAMRYGAPSIACGLAELRASGTRRLLVLPAYPQYSATTTASVFDAVTAELRTWRWVPELRFVNQYHDEAAYVEALVASIRGYWQQHGRAERLLFSFHGIPKEYFLGGDPYYCQCQKTARLVATRLRLVDDVWAVAFQSRVGNQEWLKPYTDHQLKIWGADGIRSVQVICPGFAADCLETLEEIAEENSEYFLHAGGQHYAYIPALNDDPLHIAMLADLTTRHAAGWPETCDTFVPEVAAQRLQLAQHLGAQA